MSRSRFESLSLLASQEKWCWNLFCTTCGHMVFRWGLKALARGLDPESGEWPVHWSGGQTAAQLEVLNGPLPPARGWPAEEQRAIQGTVLGCSVVRIAREFRSQDWLGHIGLLLRYTEDAERETLLLTQYLTPQLTQFVEPHGPAQEMLTGRLSQRRPLIWEDLELVEQSLRESRPQRGAS